MVQASPQDDETLCLATFLSQLAYEDLPQEVVEQAKRSILNILGCALGSANASPRRKAAAGLLPGDADGNGAPGAATIWGRAERGNLEDAALLNGIAATTADYDDTHLPTVIHPSCTSIAAILPFAETHHLSGKEVILAFVAAVEAQCAVGLAVSPSSYEKGWHITGLTGSFGGTAGVAKLLRLPAGQFAAALGHASSMASGTRAMFGTDTKTLHAGLHARNGITAAKLASAGFASCVGPIEAWAKLVSTTVDATQIAALARGGPWQILRVAFKPYPCGIVIHPLIDACLEMRATLSRRANDDDAVQAGPAGVDDIAEIEVVANPQLVRLCNVRHPRTGLETIFSLHHGCAVALVHGRAGRAEFSDSMAAHDARVRAVRDCVTVRTDEMMRDDEAILHFRSLPSPNGVVREATVRVKHALGSADNPLSKDFLEEKFSSQAESSLGKGRTDAIIKACWELDLMDDVADFVKLLGTTVVI